MSYRLALSVVVFASVWSLLPVAGASAAMPVAGKLYTGHTTQSYLYFTAPVRFNVSRSGRKLLNFRWAGGGCLGFGGPTNAWASPRMNYRVGTIKVSSSGRFSVRNVRWRYRQSSTVVKYTFSTVTGHFKSRTKAVGKIFYKQRFGSGKTCSGKVRFTAILGRALGSFRKSSPVNGATNQPTNPVLHWRASKHATSYQYCLTTSPMGHCNTRWISTARRTYADLSGLKHGTTYYWQVKARSVHGTVAGNSARWYSFTVGGSVPKAGFWVATGLTGAGGSGTGGSTTITRIFFNVSSDQKSVTMFGFEYSYSGVGAPPSYDCSGSGSSAETTPTPISGGAFSTPSVTGSWSGAGSATFNGTFASATTAHGTSQMSVYIGGLGCMFSGFSNTSTFSWTATWQG